MSGKRSMVLLLSFVLLSGVLSACGAGGKRGDPAGEPGPSGQSGGDDQKSAGGEPVELIFYSNAETTDVNFDAKYGERIRKKFPNFTLKPIPNKKGSSLPELLAAGTPIDIYYESVGQFVDGLIQYNLQYDMTELMKKHKVDLDRFEPTAIEAMRAISDGKMYGLPVSNITLALYYNKDIFDKFGVSYPKDGMTWDEIVDIAKKLTRTDGSKQYTGLGVSPAHILRLNPFSLPLVDPKTEKATIGDDRWELVFDNAFIKPAEPSGYKEKIRSLGNKLPAANSFVKDKDMAIYIALSNIFSNSDTGSEMAAMNWDMVSVPTFKEAPGLGPQLYPVYFSVASTSKHKDEAMEVIKYLTSDEFQMEMSKQGVISVLKDEQIQRAFGQETKFKDKNLKSIFSNKFAAISPKTVYDAEAEKFYRQDLTDLALGDIDINTAFRKAEEATNKYIAEAREAQKK